ncbi:23S rRNA (guanosine(2251)-2'-O)-methyltransferase RlmB [Desulfotomaculum copahuensis]|uniref:23S rRNA (Guanosine(2251)-2'-O)-methyltransferase RlmB n=1 Tax=Desulfotomaculum copahuensis TaxID=1838280 RepID=A0A1B7LGL3_9FIRM|nr:23S rRNA (guanosine(2251)-2'-O)-methyltransferase RlmB [Desulfotomaculum copahuensis]OAT85241.1 23S rRNA (guanosine(2251)-2'-O)-methyltransferase RlmB [Desulfotomaculum copahuensis]
MTRENDPENIIAGRNPVREALRAGRSLNKVFIARGVLTGPLREIYALSRERQIPVQQVERVQLDRLAPGTAHQGVAALAAAGDYVSVDDILQAAGTADPFLLLLDEVTDPHNLGAILRTADAAGVHGVIIPRHRSAGLTPAAGKAAAGAAEYVKVARVTNLVRTIDYLKQQGIWVAGAEGTAGDLFWDARLDGPLALVIGGEDKGLGRLVREKCDLLVRLPMAGRVSSLNASVAAALLTYEVVRQRRQADHGRISGR